MTLISVVIPTRNRANLLENTLRSINNQTLNKDHYEVIVVDNGSTDHTKDIVANYSECFKIKYIYEQKPGLHQGRHAGLREAGAEVITYADDDIEAFPEWLETINRVFHDRSDIVLVGGKNLPKFESTPPFWLLEMWNVVTDGGHILGDLSILDLGESAKEIAPDFVFGCNFSIRKSILAKTKGFHPDGMPFELIKYRGDGETYVSNYIKDTHLKALYHPKASVYHIVTNDRLSKEYFCKRRYAQGISDAFTHLRKGNITTQKSSFIKSILKDLLGISKRRLLVDIKTEISKTEFQRELERSYVNGYQFLQEKYKTDQTVKDWIHKKDYLD
jgi:glucosyl-dolichyl phosphate glucuronosyltransferase